LLGGDASLAMKNESCKLKSEKLWENPLEPPLQRERARAWGFLGRRALHGRARGRKARAYQRDPIPYLTSALQLFSLQRRPKDTSLQPSAFRPIAIDTPPRQSVISDGGAFSLADSGTWFDLFWREIPVLHALACLGGINSCSLFILAISHQPSAFSAGELSP